MSNLKEITGLSEDEKIPYYRLDVSKEFAEKIQLLKMEFYETDGKRIFEVRDILGNVVGYRMFIIWR